MSIVNWWNKEGKKLRMMFKIAYYSAFQLLYVGKYGKRDVRSDLMIKGRIAGISFNKLTILSIWTCVEKEY